MSSMSSPPSTMWKPLCTTCAHPSPHVYTTYSSASNIRLAVCPQCNSFVDPLIESSPLFLALDLVLLKPRVFLHLLFNRGSPPRVAVAASERTEKQQADTFPTADLAERERDTAPALGGGADGADIPQIFDEDQDDPSHGARETGRSSGETGSGSARPGSTRQSHGGLVEQATSSASATASEREQSSNAADATQPAGPPAPMVARTDSPNSAAGNRHLQLSQTLVRLALATLAAEVGVRVVSAPSTPSPALLGLTVAHAAIELGAQLAASTLLALAVLRLRGWYPASVKGSARDGRQEAFLPLLVPLVLLYTALIPLLLQLALGVWYTPRSSGEGYVSSPLAFLDLDLPLLAPLAPFARAAAEAWAQDPVWTGTRLLGGMSAGFGLRVLLPTRPWETTAIVLGGWSAATFAGRAFELVVERLL